jgi:predicted TIM-barrel fold metal-dependent hydrolase
MPILTQAPDPDPKTPKLALPHGSCDAHIHLFGPADKYPFAPDSPYISRDALAETYIALQGKLGLARAVIVSGGGYGRDCRLMADTLARYPDRFRGIALLPEDASAAELARLNGLGVRGLRMMSSTRGGHLPTYSRDIAVRAAELGWHVQFYPHGTDIIDYADRLLALPNTIVLDHFASIPAAGGTEQPAFQTLLRMLDTGRVWVKLSGPMRCTLQNVPYPAVTPLARALVRHAPERLVFGTDWPHVNLDGREMPNDGDLVDLLAEWVPDTATRTRILVDNACVLYGFPPPVVG